MGATDTTAPGPGAAELDAAGLERTALRVARSLPDVGEGRPFSPGLLVLKARDKVFCIVTDGAAEPVVTVKTDPDLAAGLERRYPTITPGRYLSKRHWVSLTPGPGITRALVESLVEDSYDLVAGPRG